MSSRGQVTAFVLLGLVLLALIGLLLFYQTNIFQLTPTQESLQTEMDAIEDHILGCLGDVGEDPLRQLGLQGGFLETPANTYRLFNDTAISYLCSNMAGVPQCRNRMLLKSQMETAISKSVEATLSQCLDVQSFRRFGRFDILTPPRGTVTTVINRDSTIVTFDYPLTLRSRQSTLEVSRTEGFSKAFDVPLGDLYGVAMDIVDAEAEFGEFDQLFYMLSKKGEYTIQKWRPYPDKVYILTKRNHDYVFQFAIEDEAL